MHATLCRRLGILLVALFAFNGTAALADAKAPQPRKPHAKKPKPEFPPFDKAMKDYKKVPTAEPPFFTLWYNKKTDSLRAQIPAGLIGKKFLIASSISAGPVATGFQLDHFLAYLDKMNKSLVLMRVDPRYEEGKGKPVSDVIKRSYGGDIILKKIPIITKKGGDVIIDLDRLLKEDFSNIGSLGGGRVNPSLSKWVEYKAFPENVELTVNLAMMNKTGGRRLGFHYSISKIPDSAKGYKPRVADDRVGYFLSVRKDWSKKHDSRTLFDRYVNRWRLEKRDPTAKLSAPKNPIIWYIEKTVPLKYRRWVKEGILEWNKAFRKCGFLDAMEVIQQEDYDPRTKDLDPEDVRYNFFRWIVSGIPFAMGPSRANPMTGQIFDADIVLDDSMVRVYTERYTRLTGGDAAWQPHDNPYLEDFFNAYPQWRYRSPRELLLPNVTLRDNPDQAFYYNLMRRMQEQGRPMCECAAGMAYQMQFAHLALEAKGLGRNSDEFIGQVLKEVVMHEVGHCLGLRHNFKGSTWLPVAEAAESNAAGEATVGSVMDYNPPIISPRGQKQGSFITRSVGPYDMWAIEYGYRPVGKPYKNEKDMLSKIAARSAEPGLDYATDEDTFGILSPDPLANRFDMGRNVMNYARHQIKLADSLIKDLSDWAVKDGESYTRLRRAFALIMGQRAATVSYVARFPGGEIANRDHKGEPNARTSIEVVDGKKQKEALKFVCRKVFAEDAYQFDPKLLSHLAAGRYWHWDSDDFDFFVDFNVHDYVAASQFACLFNLTNPFTIQRIYDNQVKFPKDSDVYTLGEHFTTLTDAIWSELYDKDRQAADGKPFINSFRRNLQRRYVNILLDLVLSKPGGTVPADANAIARLCVSKLSKRIGKVLKNADLDVDTEAHLTDVKTRIDRALEATYTVGGGSPGFGMFFFHPAADQPSTKPIPVLPRQ